MTEPRIEAAPRGSEAVELLDTPELVALADRLLDQECYHDLHELAVAAVAQLGFARDERGLAVAESNVWKQQASDAARRESAAVERIHQAASILGEAR